MQRVLLVGGSTRMPMVPRMLQQLTGWTRPDRQSRRSGGPRGGDYAGYLLARSKAGRPASFQVTNVNSHSLGIEGIEPETLRKTNVVLIPRNTPLPAKLHRAVRDQVAGPAVDRDPGAGRRKLVAGGVYGDRPDGDPGPAGRIAQGLAGRGDLRVRGQRAAERRGRGAGHAGRSCSSWNETLDCRGRGRPVTEAVYSAAGFDQIDAMVQEVLTLDDRRGAAAPRL